MREGPHPLSVYLGLAAANAKGVQDFVMQGAAGYSQDQLTEMIRGIQRYQSFSYHQGRLKTQEIWQEGTVKVLRPDDQYFKNTAPQSTPLLLIPSLINKSYIFDLAEDRSFLRWMNKKGIQTYLLDWGDLVAEREGNRDLSIAQLLRGKMCKAIEDIVEKHECPIDVLGYCMGGTLLAGAMHIVRKSVRKAVFLASPWDFHTDKVEKGKPHIKELVPGQQQGLAEMVRNWAPIVLPIIESKGFLPKENTQSLFAALGARSAVHKFIRFVSMKNDAPGTKLFVSAEDWLNDGVDLPGRIAHECVQNWFLDNEPAEGLWYIDDHRVAPSRFDFPSLVIAAQKDSLVPYSNAYALYEEISDDYSHILSPNIGHVGLVVGRNAIDEVWLPLYQWLCE